MSTDKTDTPQNAADNDTKAKATTKAKAQRTTKKTKPRDPENRKAWKRERAIATGLVKKTDDIVIA